MAIYNYEYLLSESYIINEPDILYNKDKWDNNEINLLCITGHVGSGKSTLAHTKEKEAEVYGLDDLLYVKDHFTMDNLKEYGDLIYSYFNGPGKKFYLSFDEACELGLPASEYEDKLYPGFVHYAMKWANSHKDKKYIIEGVWFFGACQSNNGYKEGQLGKPWFTPSEFDKYAFYIKGTSVLISKYRAAKRDSSDAKTKKERNKAFRNIFFKNWKFVFFDEKRINVFRKYFKNKMKNNK